MLQTIELTARNPRLKAAVERKHFIHRSYAQNNMTKEDYEKELPILQNTINSITANVLKQLDDYLKSEATKVKKTVTQDGDMKRAVADVLIEILSDVFPNDEIKGIFRQGYKIMRRKV